MLAHQHRPLFFVFEHFRTALPTAFHSRVVGKGGAMPLGGELFAISMGRATWSVQRRIQYHGEYEEKRRYPAMTCYLKSPSE